MTSISTYPTTWRRIRNAIIERDRHVCQRCGIGNGTPYDRAGKARLVVAHLDHDKANCDPLNLLTLCGTCHVQYDRDVTTWPMSGVGKTCTRCKQQRPYEAFPLNPRMRDKRDSWCYDCKREEKRARREYIRAGNHSDAMYFEKALIRFWEGFTVADNGCWLWHRTKDAKGYAVMSMRGKLLKGYRFGWEIHNGPIPDGLCVCHNCPSGDNPSCVNPDHMFLGTHAENVHDMIGKGRANWKKSKHSGWKAGAVWQKRMPEKVLRGERNPRALLTNEQAEEIRQLVAYGMTRYRAAKTYGVPWDCVDRIVKGVSYSPNGAATSS